VLETTGERFAEKRKRLKRCTAREMTRAPAAADVREEIMLSAMRWWLGIVNASAKHLGAKLRNAVRYETELL